MLKRGLSRICYLFWLVFGFPTFGVIPLLYMIFGAKWGQDFVRLDWAFLRDFFNLFFHDPEAGWMDVAPPLTTTG